MTRCRACAAPVDEVVVDLGMTPLANRFLREEQLREMEPFYPLRALVCARCFLVQLDEYESPAAIFSDYVYFSSYSTSWLEHAERYAELAIERFGLGAGSRVVEVGSNDGYLLQYFVERGIPCVGIDPATNVAEVARRRGVPTDVAFFGRAVARDVAAARPADLLVANNVIAHVPDLGDFVDGLEIALAPHGVVTIEFPHLGRLMEGGLFDTIYHEHFSYFSFVTAQRVLAAHGLTVFDVEELPTHGGSLRVYAARSGDERRPVGERVPELAARERALGMEELEHYRGFAAMAEAAKRDLVATLVEHKRAGASIAAYGAAAKGNTLLNACGVGRDVVDFCVDRNPHKQGLFLPGTHIPVLAPEELDRRRPDVVLILPWNLRDEIVEQLAHVRAWGGRFLVCAGGVREIA